MANITEFDLNNLRQKVEEKFGKPVKYSGDCIVLSNEILECTKRTVSASTIKRFFGILKSSFTPSVYTLDSLSIYIGYDNWQGFIDNFQSDQEQISLFEQQWNLIKTEFEEYSDISIKSIQSGSYANRGEYFFDGFIEKWISQFFDSNRIATAFIAPSGMGKSSIINSIVCHYWKSPVSNRKNDLYLLIDCSHLQKIINENFNLNDFLINLSGINRKITGKLIGHYKKQKCGRKIVIIFDRLEHIVQHKKLELFIVELLYFIIAYSDNPLFKIIISCRPFTWNLLINKINELRDVHRHWFRVQFFQEEVSNINIPTLSGLEIDELLKSNKLNLNYERLVYKYPRLINTLSNPYFFSLYLQLFDHKEFISESDILTHYLEKKVLKGIFREEKIKLIKSFIEITQLGGIPEQIPANNLQYLIDENPEAYSELLALGIFVEHEPAEKYFTHEKLIKFNSKDLFEFIVSAYWLRELKLDSSLIHAVLHFYRNYPERQEGILKWMICFLFKEEKIEVLKNLYSLLNNELGNTKDQERINIFSKSSIVIAEQLRIYPEMASILVPIYAKDYIAQDLFFLKYPDIDNISSFYGDGLEEMKQNINEINRFAFCNSLLLIKFVLNKNRDKALLIYKELEQIEVPMEHSLISSYYYSSLLLFQCIFNSKPYPDFWQKLLDSGKDLCTQAFESKTKIAIFCMAIVDALNLCEQYKLIIDFINYVGCIQDFSITKDKGQKISALLIFYSEALFETDKKQAIEIFANANRLNFPSHVKLYMTTRINFVEMKYLLFKKQIYTYKTLLAQTRIMVDLLNIKLFKERLERYESNLSV